MTLDRDQEDTDIIEYLYNILTRKSDEYLTNSIPYLRRVVRFLALPYCYFKLINWDECTSSRWQVFKDLLYIFFRLKYFPDNYSQCRLWEKDRSIWPFYYGSNYDPYQRGRLRKEVQKKEYEIIFEDKNICYKMCKAGNLPLPKQFGCIEPHTDYRAFIRDIFKNKLTEKIIIKPIYGKGGKDIYLGFVDEGFIMVKGKYDVWPLEQFSLKSISVVQEYTKQHQLLNVFSKSTNTIRIATLLTKDNEVLILGAFIRFGLDDSFLDNMSSGGVGVGIDIDKGVLNEFSSDDKSRKLTFHPTSKKAYKDFQIPYWQDVVDLAKKAQKFFSFYKLLGHDILVTPNGPIIIEINAIHDNVGIEQTYGPILADPRVLYEFKRYGLLINNLSYPKS